MPQILTLDIESLPLELLAWGTYDVTAYLDQIKTDWSILSYAAKWLDNKKIVYEDTMGRGVDKVRDDKCLMEGLWNLLDSADIVVAQNGKKFDIKKINARLAFHGFGPYSPVRVVDTLLVSRKYFGFTSNKLGWLSQFLTTNKKSEHRAFPGFNLWLEALKDNPEARKELKRYNIQDVVTTEELYLKLRPWMQDHPNIGAYGGSSTLSCSKCGAKKLQKRGHQVTQNGKYQRFQCTGCGGWTRGKDNLLEKDTRAVLVVG